MAKDDKQTLTPRLRFSKFRDSWNAIPLGELAKSIADRVGTMPCIPYTVTSGVGLLSQEDKFGRTIAGNSLRNYIRLKKDDFAYNKSATKAYPEGYIARHLTDANAAVPNSIFTCFRVDFEKIEPAYLDFLFAGNLHGKWLRKFLTVGARAHGSLNVSDDDLMAMPVPLPSLAEQRKIAECLGSLDEWIGAETAKLEALRSHKKGLMQQLFPRPGESLPRHRFPEFKNAEAWKDAKLGEYVDIWSGGSPSQFALSLEGTHPFVKVEDLNNCEKYQLTGREFCDDALGAIPVNSILFPKRGAAIENNKIRVTSTEILIDTNLMAIAPRDGLETEFLYYYLSNVGLAHIADSSTIPQINNKHIIPFGVLLPKVPEQNRIAACLSSLDELIAKQSREVEGLRQHKKGLMQQLFPVSEGE